MRKVYQCEHTVPPAWWFTFADRNALGEEIIVEFRKNENTHGKHSLPAMWKRKGFIDKEPETWWGVQTYVTDRQGKCYLVQGRLASGRPGRSNSKRRPGSNPGKSRQAVGRVSPDI